MDFPFFQCCQFSCFSLCVWHFEQLCFWIDEIQKAPLKEKNPELSVLFSTDIFNTVPKKKCKHRNQNNLHFWPSNCWKTLLLRTWWWILQQLLQKRLDPNMLFLGVLSHQKVTSKTLWIRHCFFPILFVNHRLIYYDRSTNIIVYYSFHRCQKRVELRPCVQPQSISLLRISATRCTRKQKELAFPQLFRKNE